MKEKQFEWTEAKKVKCRECFEKFSHLVIIKLQGVPLCPECFEQNTGYGQ